MKKTTSAPIAMKSPMWSPWSAGLPQKTGSRALATTSFEIGTNFCVELWSGPPSPNRYEPPQ